MLSVRQRGILTEAEVTDVSIKNKKNLIAPAHIYPLELDFQITLRWCETCMGARGTELLALTAEWERNTDNVFYIVLRRLEPFTLAK